MHQPNLPEGALMRCQAIASTLVGRVELARDLANVSVARRWIAELLGADHPAVFNAQLCLSELLTNSFQHTDTLRVSAAVLSTDQAVRIEVVDAGASGKEPHLRDNPNGDELDYGRGLHVVQGLTGGRWGTWSNPEGTRTTWCWLAIAADDGTTETRGRSGRALGEQ
jgi:anti-sigma regulatory factor (Ser/Thr protein kinase)